MVRTGDGDSRSLGVNVGLHQGSVQSIAVCHYNGFGDEGIEKRTAVTRQ